MFDPIPVQTNSHGEPYIVVDSQCPSCVGSAVRFDIAEPTGVATTCGNCGGEGKIKLVIPLFANLVKRDGVEMVTNRFNRASTVTYEEFLAGKRP